MTDSYGRVRLDMRTPWKEQRIPVARRLARRLYQREVVYEKCLVEPDWSNVSAECPVVFSDDTHRAAEALQKAGEELGMDDWSRKDLKRQLLEGETCISGWVCGVMAFYGWIQYRYRRTARRTSLRLPPDTAFIYRCHTKESFRGKRIYPAALVFAQQHLRGEGFRRVFIDHAIENASSRHGIIRAGFVRVDEYSIWGWGPAKFAAIPHGLRSRVEGELL